MKNTNFTCFLLSSLFFNLLQAQGFKPFIADSLREEGQMDKAIEGFQKIFKSDPDNCNNTYNYACALS